MTRKRKGSVKEEKDIFFNETHNRVIRARLIASQPRSSAAQNFITYVALSSSVNV